MKIQKSWFDVLQLQLLFMKRKYTVAAITRLKLASTKEHYFGSMKCKGEANDKKAIFQVSSYIIYKDAGFAVEKSLKLN